MLGVLGGMGPMATLDFLRKVVVNTCAVRDQDHLPVIAISIPQIPDRTEAIFAGSDTPLAAMSSVIRLLECAGATHVAIPCNTAHYWFDQLSAVSNLPIFHIVDAVAADLERSRSVDGPVGLLATAGTLRSRVYQDRLERHRISCRVPESEEAIMQGIRLAKAGELHAAGAIFADEVARLYASGCGTVILGCTEIPLAMTEAGTYPKNCVDPTDALARLCIRHLADGPTALPEAAVR